MRTLWDTKDIWVRREVMITEDPKTLDLYVEYSHDDIFEMYFNGVQIVKTGNDWKDPAFRQKFLNIMSPELRTMPEIAKSGSEV